MTDFFYASFVRWPFLPWFNFWFSKRGSPYQENGAPHISVRAHSYISKIIDSHMAFTCITERQYEPDGYAIQNGDVVVDIGAHIGSFALLAHARGARVVACEPSPENYRMLSKNIACNNMHNITALQICIAGDDGVRELFLDARNAARNGLYGAGHSVSVPALSIAELLRQQNIAQCDFLKMDCEGAEYEITEAAPLETFTHINKIAMEYHLPPYFGLNTQIHKLSRIIEKLKQSGFEVRIIPENKLRGLLFAHRPTVVA